ncbi:MAG: amidophosphoribosyltransferase, partial [Ornithinibacter sp.]
GKRLIVVDDSIVRGNTQRALVRMLREAGAAEVHVRISSPPVRWPCFYGIDFATRAELIATGLGVEEVCNSIGADSLGYISEAGMIAATNQSEDRLCTACFTGTYPVPLPENGLLGKGVLELELPIASGPVGRATGERHPHRHAPVVDVPLLDLPLDVDGVSTSAGGGAAEALLRP